MRTIRFAIVGTGGIASKHAQAIAATPGAEVGWVWGFDPGQARTFADSIGAIPVATVAELAAIHELDAATIATPSGAHADSAIPLLEAGKAVLCEKPLDISMPKVDAILSAAEQGGAPLAAVLQLRLGAGAVALKRAITEGRFGRLALCSAYLKWWREQSYYDAVDWRGTWALDGGGALMNQGIHGVDLLQWLAGMPSEVFACSGCLAHERIEVEDAIAVALKFPCGAVGVIEASTACKPGFPMRIEICGENGSAVLEDDRITRWQFDEENSEDEDIRNRESGAIVGGSGDPRAIGFEGHRILVEDLAAALRDGRPPMIPGTEARNAVALILSAYRAAREGRPVSTASIS